MPWLRSLLKLSDTCIQSKHNVNICVYIDVHAYILFFCLFFVSSATSISFSLARLYLSLFDVADTMFTDCETSSRSYPQSLDYEWFMQKCVKIGSIIKIKRLKNTSASWKIVQKFDFILFSRRTYENVCFHILCLRLHNFRS